MDTITHQPPMPVRVRLEQQHVALLSLRGWEAIIDMLTNAIATEPDPWMRRMLADDRLDALAEKDAAWIRKEQLCDSH